jgi:hypothetical protein
MSQASQPPGLARSIVIGTIGFTLLGLAGFLPWALGAGNSLGEVGMYALCAVVFVALSGPFLHRLMPGPGSLLRFYLLFTVAFAAYASIWMLIWFQWRIEKSDYIGLGLGTLAFSVLVVWRMKAWSKLPVGFIGLALLHTAGYWVGEQFYVDLRSQSELDFAGLHLTAKQCAMTAKLVWGLFYGLGFGAGIGWLFGVTRR